MVSNFDQRSQKEDVSPKGQQEYPIHSLQWEEACLFQMAHMQKGWLKPLTLSDKNQIIW